MAPTEVTLGQTIIERSWGIPDLVRHVGTRSNFTVEYVWRAARETETWGRGNTPTGGVEIVVSTLTELGPVIDQPAHALASEVGRLLLDDNPVNLAGHRSEIAGVIADLTGKPKTEVEAVVEVVFDRLREFLATNPWLDGPYTTLPAPPAE